MVVSSMHYFPNLVILSLLIATLSSYVSFGIASRVSIAQSTSIQWFWMTGGGLAMGGGIWGMHFIGMLAMKAPFRINYDIAITAVSLLAAVIFSTLAFFVIHRLQANKRGCFLGGTLLAAGIASMHYIGMAAIELPITVSYDYSIVHFSAVIALIVSILALMLLYEFRLSPFKAKIGKKVASSIVMGGGIAAVHYIAMEAATLSAATFVLGNSINYGLVISICIVEFLIQGGGALAILMGENISAKDKVIDLEKKFIQAQKMEAIGTLVGGIAHDFNNILAAISGSVFLAKRASDPEKYLKNIEIQTERASDMVKQLLAFARKDIRKMEPVCLNELIKQSTSLFKMTLPESIHVNMDLCRGRLLINGDGTQLQQILLNFVNNARDALVDLETPAITVSTYVMNNPDEAFLQKHPDASKQSYACMSVADNGYGVEKEDIAKIFEPFFTKKEVGKGTGLGLAMVAGTVGSHGGVVDVESVKGSGSTFTACFPLLYTDTDTDTVTVTVTDTVGNGEYILLVDDEAAVREVHSEILIELGYHVMTASDGLLAISCFNKNIDNIQLIIMDVVMPKMGGIKAAAKIRETSPNIPIVFATGYDKSQVLGKQDAVISNSAILTKPFAVGELCKVIDEMLH